MPRWPFVLLPLLAACAGGREGEAARAALANHRASLEILGAPLPAAPTRPASGSVPRPALGASTVSAAVPGRLGEGRPGEARLAEGVVPRQASQFMGASPEALVAALGQPSLRRDDGGGALVWLYTSGGCQLDIVMYTGAQGPRVAHVQARAGGTAQRTEAACLRDIAASAGGPGRPAAAPPEFGA